MLWKCPRYEWIKRLACGCRSQDVPDSNNKLSRFDKRFDARPREELFNWNKFYCLLTTTRHVFRNLLELGFVTTAVRFVLGHVMITRRVGEHRRVKSVNCVLFMKHISFSPMPRVNVGIDPTDLEKNRSVSPLRNVTTTKREQTAKESVELTASFLGRRKDP